MRKYITICLFAICTYISGKPMKPVEVVQAYAYNLSAWCETKDVSRYSYAIKELCSDGFRVNDEIVCDWVKKKKIQVLKHYDYEDYEKCLDELITNGVRIKVSNISIDNSIEFNIINDGHSDPYAFVSADLTVEGAVKYHIKEIFKIKGGKIVYLRNYESDLNLSRAFLMCKQRRFREAYDIFESIMYTSHNYGEKNVAAKFAISILLKKGGQLKMERYIRKYKLARNIFRDNYGGIERAPVYPMLDDKTYSFYSQNYESVSDYRQRVAILPANWKKATPYTSTYDGLGRYAYKYFINIASYYRPIEKTRFAKITRKLYGYVDAEGKSVIPAQFRFAYPFDEKVGLALVQHSNGKWGYIDMQGRPRTPQNYDVASDVFVDGKSIVIRDGYLILIDTEGNEIKSVYGYTDLSHKLQNNEMWAIYSVDSLRYDLIDFDGNIKERSYKTNDEYGLVMTYKDIGGCSLSHSSFRILGQQFLNEDIIRQQKIVDLGLSVKWAGWNIGATIPEESGIHCGWADPTGKDKTGGDKKNPVRDPKTNQWITSSYGGVNPPETISGTSLDVATALWGKGWRLPTKNEFQELIDKCDWKKVTYKGVLGYIVTGPSRNSIFLSIGIIENSRLLNQAEYWSGDLDTSNKWKNAIILKLDSTKGPSLYWEWRNNRPCVRAVYDGK